MLGSLEGQDSVEGIWRYPVKSMAGEKISFARATPRGFLGDRAYALVDKASNRAATVRTWAAALFSYLSLAIPDGARIGHAAAGGAHYNSGRPCAHHHGLRH